VKSRAVLFDFNGTLSDDEPLLLEIFTELFAEHLGWQMRPEEYAARFAGLSDREIVERAVAERLGAAPQHRPLVERLLTLRGERYRDRVVARCPVREPTRALVLALADAGCTLAIVTGAQRADVDLVLAAAGLADTFATVVTVEDVSAGKPDPEGFLMAAARLGVSPEGVLVFEDSTAGVRAATAAGMRCVGVLGTMPAGAMASHGIRTVEALTPDLVSLL
jgi:beta-phosphoglucomutase